MDVDDNQQDNNKGTVDTDMMFSDNFPMKDLQMMNKKKELKMQVKGKKLKSLRKIRL